LVWTRPTIGLLLDIVVPVTTVRYHLRSAQKEEFDTPRTHT